MKHNLWSHSSQILTNINTKTHKTDATIKKFKDWQIVCSQNLEEFLTVSQKECKLNDRNCGRLCDSWKKPCFFFFFPCYLVTKRLTPPLHPGWEPRRKTGVNGHKQVLLLEASRALPLPLIFFPQAFRNFPVPGKLQNCKSTELLRSRVHENKWHVSTQWSGLSLTQDWGQFPYTARGW